MTDYVNNAKIFMQSFSFPFYQASLEILEEIYYLEETIMMEVGLRQHIIDQRDNALKELMTQRNCEGARIFLKNEVCPVLLNWWKSTTNYRCITFYEINKGVIVSNKEVKVGCNEVADPVVLVTPEVLTVAVRISTDFGITGTEFLDSGYPAWRFSILV